jgi:hypothetical protein
MKEILIKGAMLLALLPILPSCVTNGTLPQPQCPAPPASIDRGPIPPMAGQSSVDIEISRLYIIERVRSMLEQAQTGNAGVFVREIDLKEIKDASNQRVSVIAMRLEPWLRGQSGQPASLQRSYRLTLKATPHLITPTTVPDTARRKQLLCPPANASCTTDQGMLLTFDLFELYNVSFGRPACNTPDMIDAQVVPEIFNNLSSQSPLALPTDAIGAILAGATGSTVNLTDVNISLDSFLKLGLRYDVGSTHAFDRETQLLSHYPNRDWMVDIDTSILGDAVRTRMLSFITTLAPGSTITSFHTTLSPGEVRVNGTAAVTVPGICGSSALVTIAARNPTKMCKDANGASAIVSWTDATTSSGNFCINFAKFWASIGVGTISGPPTVWGTLANVSFPADSNDIFYGTDLDLDNAFAIVGRSTVMDRKAAAAGTPRPDAPAKCPGVL